MMNNFLYSPILMDYSYGYSFHSFGRQGFGLRKFAEDIREHYRNNKVILKEGVIGGYSGKLIKEMKIKAFGEDLILKVYKSIGYTKNTMKTEPYRYYKILIKNSNDPSDICLDFYFFDLELKEARLSDLQSYKQCVSKKYKNSVGKLMLLIFFKMLKTYGIQKVTFQDLSSKVINGYQYELAVMYYLCHGKTWYDKMFSEYFPNMTIKSVYNNRVTGTTLTYDEVKAKYPKIKKIITEEYNGDCLKAYDDFRVIFEKVFNVRNIDFINGDYTVYLNQ